ncbi:MAG: hypothetical protein KUG77_04450 [Nannocystaceae bacterium]|nr:hypothetical protein [Nannocystaceae bacterium]
MTDSSEATEQTPPTGAEEVRWDLSDLYKDLDDPQLDADLAALVSMAESFSADYDGKLATKLGASLESQAKMTCLAEKLMVYLFLRRSTDATNPKIQQKLGIVQETWSRTEANHLNFFEHELVAMPEETYQGLLASDPVVKRHQSMIDNVRINGKYLLDENVERALTLRGPFGPSEWSDYIDEWEAELRFEFEGQSMMLPQILHVISNHPDGDVRDQALGVFSKGLTEQKFDRLMARTLNVVLGAKSVEDAERGYASPMSARNLGNKIDDATVEALHDVVAETGAKHARRYYNLLRKHLGRDTLRWSDRNAKLPFADNRVVPWDECMDTVLSAYGSFSSTLRELVSTMVERKWVDAPPDEGKTGGAFNFAVCLPGEEARAYNFLNYMGSTRDVMTVAHEAGHGVHGMLAAEAQGPLMFRAPMAYAETASIFGEMTTFKYLLDRAETDEQRLVMLMDKCSDHINTVVRQISFSNFERRIHEARKAGKLTAEDYARHWMDVTYDFYGKPDDLFTYEHTENLWSYVSHFLRPFYVYAYAFGELFTQSLFAVQDKFGDEFEGMYLDLLKAGGTKDAVQLMAPFGLDPRESSFWSNGIEGSLAKWLDEAEAISAKMGVE